MNSKLYRSRTDRIVGGVCGGLGQYLGIDSTIIRIIFLLLMISQGIGVLIYIILWILTPEEGAPVVAPGTAGERFAEGMRGVGDDLRQATQSPNPQASLWFGIGLVVLGALIFIQQLSEQLGIWWLTWIRLDNLWPLLIILVGVALLSRGLRKGE
jgi:phage shock protein C